MIVGSITATDFIREPAIHYYLLIGNGLMKKNRKMKGKVCLWKLRTTKNNLNMIAVNWYIERLKFFLVNKAKRRIYFAFEDKSFATNHVFKQKVSQLLLFQ